MMSTTDNSSAGHVAVLAFPFSSHGGTLLSLIRKLATATPTTAFSFFSTPKSNSSLFSGPVPDNIKGYDVPDGVPEGYVFVGKPQENIGLFLKVAQENFRRGIEAAEAESGRRISCILSDAFLWFGCEIAEQRGVPWVPLRTGGAASLSLHFYTDLIRQTLGLDGGTAGREDEILKFIPGFAALPLGDLPTGVLPGNQESPFPDMLHKMGQNLPRASAVAVNSFEELEPATIKDLKTKIPNFLPIGPFILSSPKPSSNSDEHGCLPWLDRHNAASVAYIGFGNVAIPPPDELVAIAEALEGSKTPFLWSLRDDMVKNLPEGFVERTREIGKMVPWAPQVQVLAHTSTGVFIGHCGWGSVMEAVAAGVPIIGRPFFGDQHVNMWMIENEWEIGGRIEGGIFTKNGTMRALELLLSNEKGKKMKEKIRVLKELALKAVGPNGSSTENFRTLVKVISKGA